MTSLLTLYRRGLLAAILCASTIAHAEEPSPVELAPTEVAPVEIEPVEVAPIVPAPVEVPAPSPIPPVSAHAPALSPPARVGPADAMMLLGPHDHYRPLASFDWKGMRIQIPFSLGGRAETVSDIPVDRYGGVYHAGAVLSPLIRIGARFETLRPLGGKLMILAEYEHDVPTGSWSSSTPIAGVGMPNEEAITTQLRKGYARFSVGPYFTIGGGFMTSHFGMGLLSNDGAHGWEPGSARFTDPRNGSLVLRGFIGTGPLTRAKIIATLAVDQVRKDDILLAGDSALQFIASALAGYGLPSQGGIFIVHRRQKSADGHDLEVTAIDLAGKLVRTWKKMTLTLEGEAAVIAGKTTLAPSVDYSEHTVLQVGAAARASLAFGRAGTVLDLVYASGDQNLSDSRVTGFKAESNFEEGLLLFRYMQAAQTARAAITAADPTLSAVPTANLDRVPSRGSLTNTVVVFPRFWVRPVSGLEVYGGPLFAFAPVKNVDPLNTTLAGGAPRNAANGNPGSYYGTELDLGVRYRALVHGVELNLGAEGAMLFPGSAFQDEKGDAPRRVLGGRLILMVRL